MECVASRPNARRDCEMTASMRSQPEYNPRVERIDATASRALRLALEAQPPTQGKVLFAWSLAAGPTLARAASATWRDGTLYVHTKSERWRIECERARPLILSRLSALLGPDMVHKLIVSTDDNG